MKGMEEMRLNTYLFEAFMYEDGDEYGERDYKQNEEREFKTREYESEMRSYKYVLKRAQMLCYQMILKEESRKKIMWAMYVVYAALTSAVAWGCLQEMVTTRLEREVIIIVVAALLVGMACVFVIATKRMIEPMRTKRERICSFTSKFQIDYHLTEITVKDREKMVQEYAEVIEYIVSPDVKLKSRRNDEREGKDEKEIGYDKGK